MQMSRQVSRVVCHLPSQSKPKVSYSMVPSNVEKKIAAVYEPNFSFILSDRGRDQLVYQGYSFKFARLRSGSPAQSWRCCNRCCRAAIDYNPVEGCMLPHHALHNHPPPDPSRLNRKKISAVLKSAVIADSSVRVGVNSVKAVASGEGVVLSKQDLAYIYRNVGRARKQCEQIENSIKPEPASPSSLLTPDETSS